MRLFNLVITLALVALIFVCSGASNATAASSSWSIKKENWSSSDEKNYSQFIQALGESGCRTVDKCLKSPANPYRGSDPADISWTSDCAKFPYLLRAYFAWKNNLPFGYVNDVAAVGNSNDLRYSPEGNYPVRRRSLVQNAAGEPLNAIRALRSMLGEVNTSRFRIHPTRDGVEKGLFQDFVSVRIDRESVRPGTLVYDAAGHVIVVYKVEKDGRVRFFDAHPDNTVSRGVYGMKFARSRPGSGAGFKNFRPLKLAGAVRGSTGELIGGRITTLSLGKTPGYSTEQFFGTEVSGPVENSSWTKAKFKANGQVMGFQDFVRTRLAIGELRFHPVEEMENAMEALCGDIQDRVLAVKTAIDSGVQNKSHPARLPMNIYGTAGEWEEYSSPSRDARLKTSFLELRGRVQQMVEMHRRGDPRVDYPGNDLPGDLRRAYAKAANECSIEYRKTDGSRMRLDYDDIVERLFELSFDPYNCVELRWGAKSSQELATCNDSNEKRDWHEAEQRLRNQLDRAYDVKMGFSLRDLQNRVPGSGVDRAPDVNLKGYLNSL